ncbi:MAG TPA: hypothetical protein ENJ53_03385 [Phaeodactylibacter sp.]|nr:hypothetical protein [Phaeodactylibacter sp.]
MNICAVIFLAIFVSACAGTKPDLPASGDDIYRQPQQKRSVVVVVPRVSEEQRQKILEREENKK